MQAVCRLLERDSPTAAVLQLGRLGGPVTAALGQTDQLTCIAAVEADLAVQDERGLEQVLAALFGRTLQRARQRRTGGLRNIIAVEQEPGDGEHTGSLERNFLMSRYFLLGSNSTIVTPMATADCQCRAFQCAVDILGRPWNAFLLTMLQERALRFSEIAARPNGPGDKVLASRLKDLEARGLIERRVDPGPPVRVTYALTKQGRAFGDVSAAIERWGRELREPPRRRRAAR